MLSQILLVVIRFALGAVDIWAPTNKTLKSLDPKKVLSFIIGFFTMIIIVSIYNYCSPQQ